MKAITSNAINVKALREREVISNKGVPAMKSRIKTCNLRQARPALEQQSNRRKVIWLMEWREGNIGFQSFDCFFVDENRCLERGTPMNHPVADGRKRHLLGFPQPLCDCIDRSRYIPNFVGLIALIDQRRGVGRRGAQSRSRPDAID